MVRKLAVVVRRSRVDLDIRLRVNDAQTTVSKHVATETIRLIRNGESGVCGWVRGGEGGGGVSEWLIRAVRLSKDRGGRGPPPEQTTIVRVSTRVVVVVVVVRELFSLVTSEICVRIRG